MTFFWPGITLAALVFLFAAYALVDGVVSLVGAVRAVTAHERWGSLLLEGIVGIAAAVITVLWPAITALSLVFCDRGVGNRDRYRRDRSRGAPAQGHLG